MKVVFRILGRIIRFILFITVSILGFVFEVLADMFKALKGALQNY